MHFVKAFFFLATTVAIVSAGTRDSAGTDGIRVNSRDNCNGYIGDCFSNGCDPVFSIPTDTIGQCTSGEYNGCPCEKCGSGVGYVGGCGDNGCEGYEGQCTAGQYNGCPCD